MSTILKALRRLEREKSAPDVSRFFALQHKKAADPLLPRREEKP